MKGLSVNKTLETLHVWNNQITEVSADMLLEIIQRYNNSVQEMLIFGNNIENIDAFIQVSFI